MKMCCGESLQIAYNSQKGTVVPIIQYVECWKNSVFKNIERCGFRINHWFVYEQTWQCATDFMLLINTYEW
jgi:hypothetical protein